MALHCDRIQKEIAVRHALNVKAIQAPLVVVPIEYWTRVSEKALRFAYSLSPEVLHIVHVDWKDQDIHGLRDLWADFVTRPVQQAGFPVPRLMVLNSLPLRDFADSGLHPRPGTTPPGAPDCRSGAKN